MVKHLLPSILSIIVVTAICQAEGQIRIDSQKARESYSLGYEFGSNLKRQGIEIDTETLLLSIREALEGKAPEIGPAELRDTLQELRKKVMVLQDKRFRETAARNLEEGKRFLEENSAREGVKTLPSGLQYKIVREGKGDRPKETDSVVVHYRGTFSDGKEFDNSHARGEPATIQMSSAIAGWKESLQLMSAGSVWQIFVPSTLAYGERQFGRIPPNSTLVFEIELLSIRPPES